ncbi:MAG: SMP-30/gluconolactonase/LRE family protein [Acidobacteria bacterium]|nr:SMP-30/gluconolactonase/LRE family protein [Acidobacteriota bacterium]
MPELPIERFEIFATGLDHPECLAFDSQGVLWAGGEAGQIYRIDGNVPVTVAELGGFTGGIAWHPDGSALFACNPKHGVVRVKPDGEWDVFASGLICPNYGLFNSAGDYYVTDSGHWKKRNGRLLWYAPDGACRVMLDGYGYTNGLALSADERWLYVVESDTHTVFRVDLAARKVEVYAEEVGRLPDGLALDDAGNLYVACYASDNIIRISPQGKKFEFACDRWAILLSRPTNLCFRDGYVYVANLGRQTITRGRLL